MNVVELLVLAAATQLLRERGASLRISRPSDLDLALEIAALDVVLLGVMEHADLRGPRLAYEPRLGALRFSRR